MSCQLRCPFFWGRVRSASFGGQESATPFNARESDAANVRRSCEQDLVIEWW